MEIATAVGVVQVEANANALACIDCKFRLEMVFASLLVAAIVVTQIGDRRQRIGKVPLVGLSQNLVIRLRKDEWRSLRPIDEDT